MGWLQRITGFVEGDDATTHSMLRIKGDQLYSPQSTWSSSQPPHPVLGKIDSQSDNGHGLPFQVS